MIKGISRHSGLLRGARLSQVPRTSKLPLTPRGASLARMAHTAGKPALALVATGALLLSACTGEETGSANDPNNGAGGGPTAGEIEPEPELSGDDIVAEASLPMAGKDVTAEIHAVVRSGDSAIATIDFTGLAEDDRFSDSAFGNDFGSHSRLTGIRLVDLENDEIYHPGLDNEGNDVVPADLDSRGEQRVQLVYDAPNEDVESLGLFLPSAGFVPDIPVIDAAVPAGTLDGEGAPVDGAKVADAGRYSLESFTRELDGAVETLTSTEDVVVTLGSDVLFDVDEDTLSSEAVKVIKKAADHLSDREPGKIEVVGHTDDVLSADYNQKLSERRATAVAKELEEHIDTGEYEIVTEGKGKTEPLVKNDSDENRAKNRRVTLTLVSEIEKTTELDRSGQAPEFEDGPSATGEEGIEMGDENSTRHFRYTASAREKGGHLIVDLTVEALDDEVDSSFDVAGLAGHWNYRGSDLMGAGRTASGIQVLDGDTRVFPLDYLYDGSGIDEEIWLPATDLFTLGRIDGGQQRVFSMIYPRLGDWDTVAIRALGGLGVDPFELTDIPIERDAD